MKSGKKLNQSGKNRLIDEAEVLPFAGFLGHRYVVVVSQRGAVPRAAGLETNSIVKVATYVGECADARWCRVYEQVSRGKWKTVPIVPSLFERAEQEATRLQKEGRS